MIIESLNLQNFRRFASVELEFPRNLIGVIGTNGSGKTTLLEAIGWVLYGNKVVRTEKSEVRSQFADTKSVCSAEMLFEIGGHQYKIRRELRGKNAATEAAVYRAGETAPVAVQDTGVNDFVEQLLGLDYQSFFASVFAKQRDLAALSEMRPEERRKAINRLINIERIDQARVTVRRDANEKEIFLKGRESGLKDEEELRQHLKEQTGLIDKITTESTAAETQVRKLSGEHQRLKTEFENAGSVRDRFHELQRKLETYAERLKNAGQEREQLASDKQRLLESQAEMEKLKPRVDRWKALKKEKEALDALELAFRDRQHQEEMKVHLSGELRKIESDMNKWKERLRETESLLKELEKSGKETQILEERQKTLVQTESELRGNVRALQQQMTEVKQQLDTVKRMGADSPCPVCNRPLKDHYGKVVAEFGDKNAAFQAQVRENETRLTAVTEELSGVKKRLEAARENKQRYIAAQGRRKEIEEYLENSQEEYREKAGRLAALEQKISQHGEIDYDPEKHRKQKEDFEILSGDREKWLRLEADVRRLPDVEKLIAAREEMIEQTSREQQETAARQKELAFDETEYQTKKQALDTAADKLQAASREQSEQQKKLALARQSLEQIRKELDTQQEIRREMKQLKDDIFLLKMLDEHFSRFRLELAGRIRPLIAHRASELLALTTNSRYSIMELDTDYNIFIFDGTEKFGIRRFSGGEQDLANLCLRIAISQVVAERSGGNPLNFIVLDEIFGSQDQERKSLIMNALNHLSSQFRQIFVVTHIEDIKDSLPVLINVREKDARQSIATLV